MWTRWFDIQRGEVCEHRRVAYRGGTSKGREKKRGKRQEQKELNGMQRTWREVMTVVYFLSIIGFFWVVCVFFFLDAAQFNSEIFGRMFYIQPVFLGFTGKKTFQELIVFPQKDSKNGVRTETGKETRDKTKTFIIKWQIFDWLSNSKMGWIMISTVKMLV